jgi:hypothetical protein
VRVGIPEYPHPCTEFVAPHFLCSPLPCLALSDRRSILHCLSTVN